MVAHELWALGRVAREFWVGSVSLLEGIGSGRYQPTWSGSIGLQYIVGIVLKYKNDGSTQSAYKHKNNLQTNKTHPM